MSRPFPEPLVTREPGDIERKLAAQGIAAVILWGALTAIVATYELPFSDEATASVAIGVTQAVSWIVAYFTRSRRTR